MNHRYCDVRLALPSGLLAASAPIEAAVRSKLKRGRVDLGLSLKSTAASAGPDFDLAQARVHLDALNALRGALGLQDPVSLAWLIEQPGVTRREGPQAPPVERLLGLVTEAVEDLLKMRAAEGEALARALREHLDRVRGLSEEISGRVQGAVQDRARRLQTRLQQLLGDDKLDEARLAHEVALLADRSDVTEELERIQSHAAQFQGLIEKGGAVGRKLDFMLQELNREANTIGSKCSDAEMAYQVVELKAELERMREQVQNVE